MVDAHGAAVMIGRYMKASQACQYQLVGAGPYAIVNEFDDGGRFVSFVGFESAGDAELFASFMRARLAIEEPRRSPMTVPGRCHALRSSTACSRCSRRRRLRTAASSTFASWPCSTPSPATRSRSFRGGVVEVLRRDRRRLSAEQYAAALALLAERGYLRGHARSRSTPFADLDPYIVALDFGYGFPRPFMPADDYYALPIPLRKVA